MIIAISRINGNSIPDLAEVRGSLTTDLKKKEVFWPTFSPHLYFFFIPVLI